MRGLPADLFPPYQIGFAWISLHCCTVKWAHWGVLMLSSYHVGQTQLQCKQVLQGSELKNRAAPPLLLLGVVTSILPMSHQGAPAPGYVQNYSFLLSEHL